LTPHEASVQQALKFSLSFNPTGAINSIQRRALKSNVQILDPLSFDRNSAARPYILPSKTCPIIIIKKIIMNQIFKIKKFESYKVTNLQKFLEGAVLAAVGLGG
jgi:hypothetical protein